jgi:hypothetical protein
MLLVLISALGVPEEEEVGLRVGDRTEADEVGAAAQDTEGQLVAIRVDSAQSGQYI